MKHSVRFQTQRNGTIGNGPRLDGGGYYTQLSGWLASSLSLNLREELGEWGDTFIKGNSVCFGHSVAASSSDL